MWYRAHAHIWRIVVVTVREHPAYKFSSTHRGAMKVNWLKRQQTFVPPAAKYLQPARQSICRSESHSSQRVCALTFTAQKIFETRFFDPLGASKKRWTCSLCVSLITVNQSQADSSLITLFTVDWWQPCEVKTNKSQKCVQVSIAIPPVTAIIGWF